MNIPPTRPKPQLSKPSGQEVIAIFTPHSPHRHAERRIKIAGSSLAHVFLVSTTSVSFIVPRPRWFLTLVEIDVPISASESVQGSLAGVVGINSHSLRSQT